MILLDAATNDEAIIPQLAIFAAQLRAAGLHAVIAKSAVPEDLGLTQKYDLLPFMRDDDGAEISGLIVIGADILDAAKITEIAALNLAADAPVLLLGAFGGRPAQIAVRADFALATGREPECIDISDMPGAMAGDRPCPCFGVAMPTAKIPYLRGRAPIQFLAINAKKGRIFPILKMLSTSKTHVPVAYVTTADKADWTKANGPGHNVYSFSEIAPTALSSFGDILVVTGAPGGNFRALTYLNNLIAKGALIVDATPNGDLVSNGIAALQGPGDPAYLLAYLKEVVLPNLDGVADTVPATNYAKSTDLLRFLETTEFARFLTDPAPMKPGIGRINFLPTNGVGLGHAQRCSLIAEHLPRTPHTSRFFAFPTCLPMIRRFGFDATPLVSRSTYHEPRGANDLVNYARMHAGMGAGDTLVFDGGHVYHSVFRTIVDYNLRSVWIRRGLWKKEQDNSGPLDREKFFTRVIVPSEAFDELNENYSTGDHVHHVGPIVQHIADPKNRDRVRAGLRDKFDRDFDKLVVTMLGSGVAADLSAHAQTIAAMVDERDDTINLIVVWPTAGVPPGWYGWNNTYVISTHHAALLLQAADLFVSAAGFNSFHEAMYNRVPTIFIPQEQTYLDDQSARAECAAEHGLAAVVPQAKIGQLAAEARRFLDRGKGADIRKALLAHDLPEPGNARAAELIVEVAS